MASVNRPIQNIPEYLPKNAGNEMLSSLLKSTKSKTRYRNTRRNQKNETKTSTTKVPLKKNNSSPESKQMAARYATVPECVKSLKDKSNILVKLYEDTYKTTSIPNELYNDLKEFKEFVKEFDVSTFNCYVLQHNLMDFEDVKTVKEFDPINPESEYSLLLLRNNMKLGWLSRIMYRPVEKLVGVN